jgi:ankyrin repeat protein
MLSYETIREYINPDRINTKDTNGNTPLHLACIHGDYELVQLCLKNGADRNQMNNDGHTSYQIVCETNKTLLLKLFYS